MASFKVKFRPSSISGNRGSIYYQIIHRRITRQISTGYQVKPDEWDDKRSTVIVRHIRERILRDIERLTSITRKLDNKGVSYTADDIIDTFRHYKSEYSLFAYMENLITNLKQNGKARTAETYTAAIHSFRRFLNCGTQQKWLQNETDIMLDCLTSEIMEGYEAWHKVTGNTNNTISFYIRIFRAVYNRAVEDGIIEDRKPFRRVYTGVDKTVKRALPLNLVRSMKSLDLSLNPKLDYARDLFMLSFYLRGISFIDLAFLKKTDLQNGKITYNRRKTGQRLEIAWTKEMQNIIDKYPTNNTRYLVPIITRSGINERAAYRNASYIINRNLKKVAEMIGSPIPLTLYVARHSWASIAKAKGIPIGVISEGMGHDNETTTRIYLASLDTAVVDKANELIISSI